MVLQAAAPGLRRGVAPPGPAPLHLSPFSPSDRDRWVNSPALSGRPQDGFSRLKRWIMIGDHHQLPPVIKNMAFQKYSNMEQSLFTRFVRVGVPTVDLDAQGRARAR